MNANDGIEPISETPCKITELLLQEEAKQA